MLDNLKLGRQISIHALRGEGDDILGCGMPYFFISIHALRGEGDPEDEPPNRPRKRFQSTPSVGRATGETEKIIRPDTISIHALRGEGDSSVAARRNIF